MFREFSQDSDAPVSRFEQMLKTNEVYFFDAVEFESIIQYYIDTGEVNLAKKALKMGINQHPLQTDLLLLKTELLILDGNHEEANQLLDVIEEMEPSNQEVYIQKATISSKNKNHQASIEHLFKSLEYCDDPQEIWCLLAMEFMVLEDYSQAKEFFKRCIERDPEDYQVLYNLLYCLEYLKTHEEAIEILNKILEYNPYNEIAWLEIGKQYLHLNQKKEALSAFDFAIISEDNFTGAYIEKGKLLKQLGRFNEAIEHFEISMQLDDPSSFIYIQIANCHQRLGNDQLCLQFFKKGIQEDPTNEKAWTGIIDFYMHKQDPNKANYYCQKALQINENYLSYWKRSALLNKELKQYAEAEIAYQNTIELGNYELNTWSEWIDTLIELNEWEKACLIGQQAKEFYPEEATLDFKIAGCFSELGKTIEMEYYMQNVRQNKHPLSPADLTAFPRLGKLI